jgi:membrane protein insertase Oxa1/YidC/SpoIIIJ
MWLTRKFNGNSQLQSQPQDAQTKASMRMMDILFPGMTLWMAFSFSGMLGLYWTFQALLGLLQSFILAKAMPLPKYTEEEIKSFHKAQKEAEKAQREAAKSQPKYRSLHYIDDDDYDILPDAPVSEEKKDKKIDGNMPEIKD